MFHSRKRNTLNEGVLFGFVFSYRLLGEKVDPLYYNTMGHHLCLRVSGEGQKEACAEPFPPTAPCRPLGPVSCEPFGNVGHGEKTLEIVAEMK